jgi:hypothetical protein
MDQNQQQFRVEEEDSHSNCTNECPICSNGNGNGNMEFAKLKLEMHILKVIPTNNINYMLNIQKIILEQKSNIGKQAGIYGIEGTNSGNDGGSQFE